MVSKKRPFDGQLTPLAITTALVLIIVGALASPRVRGHGAGLRTGSGDFGSEAVRSDTEPQGPQVFRNACDRGRLEPAVPGFWV